MLRSNLYPDSVRGRSDPNYEWVCAFLDALPDEWEFVEAYQGEDDRAYFYFQKGVAWAEFDLADAKRLVLDQAFRAGVLGTVRETIRSLLAEDYCG